MSAIVGLGTLIFSGIIAIFTYLVWRTYEDIAWRTGAMESHSLLQLKLEAMRGIRDKPIELVWWDYSKGKPPTTAEHGKPVTVERIYIGMPKELREKRDNVWKQIARRLRGR